MHTHINTIPHTCTLQRLPRQLYAELLKGHGREITREDREDGDEMDEDDEDDGAEAADIADSLAKLASGAATVARQPRQPWNPDPVEADPRKVSVCVVATGAYTVVKGGKSLT